MSAGRRAASGGSRRFWGWYRLTDSWAQRVVDESGVGAGQLVVDIGAGLGALVGPLLATGARVVAVELHDGRAQALRTRWPGEVASRRLIVVRVDALDFRLPRMPFSVVANPPYAIASPLIRRLLAPGSGLRTAHLVLPRPVARRWVSGEAPGAGRWSRQFSVGTLMPLPRTAFRPPPHVDSQLVLVKRR